LLAILGDLKIKGWKKALRACDFSRAACAFSFAACAFDIATWVFRLAAYASNSVHDAQKHLKTMGCGGD
jgi:hypothetical protein